jgi:hypothetical protein
MEASKQVDVVKEVILKVKRMHHKKQWWSHLTRWIRWKGKDRSRESSVCFKVFKTPITCRSGKTQTIPDHQ